MPRGRHRQQTKWHLNEVFGAPSPGVEIPRRSRLCFLAGFQPIASLGNTRLRLTRSKRCSAMAATTSPSTSTQAGQVMTSWAYPQNVHSIPSNPLQSQPGQRANQRAATIPEMNRFGSAGGGVCVGFRGASSFESGVRRTMRPRAPPAPEARVLPTRRRDEVAPTLDGWCSSTYPDTECGSHRRMAAEARQFWIGY